LRNANTRKRLCKVPGCPCSVFSHSAKAQCPVGSNCIVQDAYRALKKNWLLKHRCLFILYLIAK
jgi:hypothetical protein